MADVIGSQRHPGSEIQEALADLLAFLNDSHHPWVLSPFVTTLGDEFQGLAHTPAAVCALIFAAEHFLRSHHPETTLRYVLLEGEIETKINTEHAFGMLGPGLADARHLLTDSSAKRPRFQVQLTNQRVSQRLQATFDLLENLTDDWSPNDLDLIQAMLKNPDDAQLGAQFGRARTSIYRRRRTLRIADYHRLHDLSLDTADQPWTGPLLHRLRQRKGLSLVKLSQQTDFSAKTLSTLEKKSAPLPSNVQQQCAAAFHLPQSPFTENV